MTTLRVAEASRCRPRDVVGAHPGTRRGGAADGAARPLVVREVKDLTQASRVELLLRGRPGREGFLFHDGWNQPIHQAAPGLLGLLEGRYAVERWKPAIVRWMDEAGHFFRHILKEFEGEPEFEPVRLEVEAIRETDMAAEAKNRFLFHHFATLAGELERQESAATASPPSLPVPPSPGDVSLNGPWTAYLRQGPGRYVEQEIHLPTNWELVPGIQNYAGSMRFTRTIEVPRELRGRCVFLDLCGVDYFVDVWVNGHHVGGHEGCFAPFCFDVSPALRYGDVNVVRLAVTSPNEPAGDGVGVTSGWDDFRPQSSFPNRKTLVKGTLGHHDAKRGGAWSSLTSQDANTGGVWNDVGLRVRGPIHFRPSGSRVTTLALDEVRDSDCAAAVEMQFSVHNGTDRPTDAELAVTLCPANFEGPCLELDKSVTLRPGANQLHLQEDELAPVRPWQPWDQGVPHLYSVQAVLHAEGHRQDEVSFETGFRTLSVTPIGESPGRDGALVVNGSEIFVRGTNLLPTYWLSEYTPARIERDFQLLRDAGFNSVMVHTLVAPKRFYEQANRSGFLVFQIFPLQWTYEQSLDFTDRAIPQIKELTALLYNEPSVVSYETHNEPDMRTAEGLDNRLVDFQLHGVFRESDPRRWATTFSGGNHAYPGQFYPLRDDNSFATLPARFLEEEFHGRRISRHPNMPTEFGIQGLPNVELFEALLDEERVSAVLQRIRTDTRWLARRGETWEQAESTIAAAKDLLGDGSWVGALGSLDWRLLWRFGDLGHEIARIEHDGRLGDTEVAAELVSRRLALLLMDVLHYGAFKGENFWFGLWRPARTLEETVQSSQDRQYRLHKEAIETFLNAGVTGPIVGFFSFMFRDCDRQAPTWGVVDAEWVPKKAYRAYVESNRPVRVSLPHALRCPVKLPGDCWFGAEPERRQSGAQPWVEAELIVANDTSQPLRGAQVCVWLEDADGGRVPLVDRSGHRADDVRVEVDVGPRTGFSYFDRVPAIGPADPLSRWVVPSTLSPGTYQLKARISSSRSDTLSTNSYELLVPDTAFEALEELSDFDVARLLNGAEGSAGFHYWQGGHVVYRAEPGVQGFLAGLRQARLRGLDLYETIQGEHLIRHVLAELEVTDPSGLLADPVWQIRSEILSPAEKAAVLVRYLELFAVRAHAQLSRTDYDERSTA